MESMHNMKNTPIGLIPEGWSARPLGDLCEIHGRIGFRGYTKADLVRKGEGAITFSPSDIEDQRISYKDCDYISWAKYIESPEIQVNEGDILFCKTASIGKCAQIWDLKEKATINPQFVLLNAFKCNSSLLYYMLAFSSFQNRVLVITGGSTIPTISQEAMKKQLIPIPDDPEEQKRIAETLLSIDRIIGVLDEAIGKKRQIKEGLMPQLLTGKTRLPGFSEDWVELELGAILSYEQPGPFLVHSTDYVESGIPVLTAGKTFILGYTDENFGIYDKLPVIIFDDFVTESKYVDFPFKAKSSAMKMLSVRDKTLHNVRFIYDVMQLIDFPMTDHKRWWIAEYSHLKVRVPASIEEENAIANTFSSIDGEIHSLESQRDKYRLIKQGMMQELLTGKTRLI